MLKILQARLQQYVNCELPDVQAGFRKGRGTRDQIANIHWIIEKVGEFQKKHLFLLYWLCQSLWLCGSNKLWKILKEMGIPDHLTCLWRNLYAGQCLEPAREFPPMTKVMRRGSDMQRRIRTGGAPLDLPEHLPPNQNLSVLLFHDFHQLFWH